MIRNSINRNKTLKGFDENNIHQKKLLYWLSNMEQGVPTACW